MAITTLAEVLSEPALRPDEVEAEREVILEELAAAEDNPGGRRPHPPRRGRVPRAPAGPEVLGTEASIDAMARDDIAAFHERWYRPANLVIAAAGAVDHDDVVDRLDGFAGAGAVASSRCAGRPRRRRWPRWSCATRSSRPTSPSGWRGLDQDDPDRWALAVANYVLGGGTASRLFQQVREERGLAYSVFSSVSLNVDSGALTVYAATSPAKLAEVLAIVDDIVGEPRRRWHRDERAGPGAAASSRAPWSWRRRTAAPAWPASGATSRPAARCSPSTSS